MTFDDYKKELFDFEGFNLRAREGFEERLGEPTELEASIGLISIAFNNLDAKISDGITKLLNVGGQIGKVVTSELSFKIKLNLFSSLITELRTTYYFNRLEGEGFSENYQREFIKSLSKCEELRNRVMHSVFVRQYIGGQLKTQRLKTTARAKRGLIEMTEDLEIHNLLNIYDFIVSMEMEIGDFFIDFRKKI
jgi:hypothetical protein